MATMFGENHQPSPFHSSPPRRVGRYYAVRRGASVAADFGVTAPAVIASCIFGSWEACRPHVTRRDGRAECDAVEYDAFDDLFEAAAYAFSGTSAVSALVSTTLMAARGGNVGVAAAAGSQPLQSQTRGLAETAPLLGGKTLQRGNHGQSSAGGGDATLDDGEDLVHPPEKRLPTSSAAAGLDCTLAARLKRKNERVPFSVRLEQCRAFKEKHGHLKLKKSDPEMGRWLTSVRAKYKLFKSGKLKPSSKLTPAVVKELTELGFVWQAGKRPRPTVGGPKKWEERCRELAEFKRRHGHTRVKQTDGALGHWVRKQRAEFRALKKGWKTEMTPDRLRKLIAVGFTFEVRKYKAEAESLAMEKKKVDAGSGGNSGAKESIGNPA